MITITSLVSKTAAVLVLLACGAFVAAQDAAPPESGRAAQESPATGTAREGVVQNSTSGRTGNRRRRPTGHAQAVLARSRAHLSR